MKKKVVNREAFVLYVIRKSLHNLDFNAIVRLTGLSQTAAFGAIKKLESKGLIAASDADGRSGYQPVGLARSPLIPGYLAWLRVFCSRPIPCDTWDTETMTLECCGIVILSAIVSGSRDAWVLTRATTFPEGFVGLVLEMMEDLDLFWSDRLFDLERTILQSSSDLTQVDDSLNAVKEEFWSAATCASLAMLGFLRDGQQYGGQVDPSIEEGTPGGGRLLTH